MEFINRLSTEYMTGEREYGHQVSNCCSAHTTEPDNDGLARCSDCKEMCSVIND